MTVCVAPKRRAISQAGRVHVDADDHPARAILAPWITESPTPARPGITATDSPVCTFATLEHGSTPVWTPQTRMQAEANGCRRPSSPQPPAERQ